ncbi:MAG: precorrin-8X methylmutase [Euryarchaeota archaeon]|nr:precorrin-8X methylmutase [Euryarchaeota archaeon]
MSTQGYYGQGTPGWTKPDDIERKSFEIIDKEIGPHEWTPTEYEVVRRVIHATADFDFNKTMAFHTRGIDAAMEAIHAGGPLISDVEMIKAGVNKSILTDKWGMGLHCYMTDPDVVEEAKSKNHTRAQASMRKAARTFTTGMDALNCIYAIGNAPTALLELCDLIHKGEATPALIIGVPVGFVNAAEAKEAAIQSGVPYIVARGRKGGSTVAVAILNALARLSLQ